MDELNEQWVVTPLSQLKTNDPDRAKTPCLEALECLPPCELSEAWGGTFLLALGALVGVYVGAGAVYSVKAQGKSLRQDGVIGILPQAEFFMTLRGLVEDGLSYFFEVCVHMSSGTSRYVFSFAVAVCISSLQPNRCRNSGRRTAYANAAGGEDRRFSAPGAGPDSLRSAHNSSFHICRCMSSSVFVYATQVSRTTALALTTHETRSSASQLLLVRTMEVLADRHEPNQMMCEDSGRHAVPMQCKSAGCFA